MDGLNDSTASNAVTRRLSRKSGILIISKRDNPAILHRRRSRTDRAWGILEALKAVKAAVEDKKARDLAIRRKRSGKRKLPANIIERIKFGKRLAMKRKNERWQYCPAKEPDYNVGLKYFDEEENNEDEDDDKDEYWYEENGNLPWYMCLSKYGCFDATKRRFYGVWVKTYRLPNKELREWLQGAIDRIKSAGGDRYFFGYPDDSCVIARLSEEEADAIAGLDDVLFVEPFSH